MSATIAGAEWLAEPELQRLLAVLCEGGEQARIAGGAVRNALLGQAVQDVDIATTNPPRTTLSRAGNAGFRAIPTGEEHGTITVIAGGRVIEVTTLRADVETDGRHAKVVFGRDWKADAERRDFSINALYATADGEVIDLVGGLADLEARRLRFIGDAETRIREDFLRILRFFRFFAWYGAGRPDAEGLKACARLKEGLGRLSAERVSAELKKLLAAPDPSRALLWMRQTSVLTQVVPETEKWGIDAVHGLIAAEKEFGWLPDALLRLEAMLPPDGPRIAAMAERLRLSNAEAARLAAWAASLLPKPDTSDEDLARLLYRSDVSGICDRLRLALASAQSRGERRESEGYARLLGVAERWQKPALPVKGADLVGLGMEPGAEVGLVLKELEQEWLDSGFRLDRGALLERAAAKLGN